MKPHIVTKGIVLARTDYQEADRILTVLTPDHGKLRLIAKGVRKPKSKLAGGIELFSVNDITVLPSQRDLKTLISSRLQRNFDHIVKDITRTMLGYELLKRLNRVTEDEPGPEYYQLLVEALAGLDDSQVAPEVLELWFNVQLMKIGGQALNLSTDTEEVVLSADQTYVFDFESMAFRQQHNGPYGANHIKLLRLASASKPTVVAKVNDGAAHKVACLELVKNIAKQTA